MKILMVMIRWKGGVGRVVENQRRELENLGHEVEVISREDDLQCYSTKDAWFKLQKEVNTREYDILFTHDWSCALPLIHKRNHYVHLYGFETGSPLLQKIVGILKGKNVTVTDKALKKQFPKATWMNLGIDLDEFYDMKQKRIPNSVGFANWETKSYNYEEIKEAVNKLGYNFIKTGMKLKREDMPKFYNKIETFISLPKEFAGFNMSWVEAMACGVPKIVGNYNGVGKSLDINHVENFKSIVDALKNAKIKKKYKINPDFNWKNNVKKLLKLWEK